MKTFFTLFFVAIAAFSANAQIVIDPATGVYNQDFEGTFTNGMRIDFLPGWFGNQIQPTAGVPRIHRDTLRPYAGLACLAALPTATVKDTIIISYDMAGANAANITFWAASDSVKTAIGSRGAVVYHEFSIDGGTTYSVPVILGDSLRFPHNVTPYQQYSLTVADPNNAMTSLGLCKSRFVVSRGAGSGTAARFLMDNFKIQSAYVSTERVAEARNLSIVPNPNTGIFSIKTQNIDTQTADIEIFDAVGKQIFVEKGISIHDFTMSNRLEKGIYTLVLRADAQVFTQRVVVQ